MKAFILSFLVASSSSAFGCAGKELLAEAQKFVARAVPAGAKVEVQEEGNRVTYSAHAKRGEDSFSETGTLSVSRGGRCEFKIVSQQTQVQGDTFKKKSKESASLITTDDLRGTWSSPCIQTQNNSRQGYVVDRYTFSDGNTLSFTRRWFKKAGCQGKSEPEGEQGSFSLGGENLNNGFNPPGTTEIKLRFSEKTELGLVWLSDDRSELRISRGFGSSQNTMLDLSRFKKSN